MSAELQAILGGCSPPRTPVRGRTISPGEPVIEPAQVRSTYGNRYETDEERLEARRAAYRKYLRAVFADPVKHAAYLKKKNARARARSAKRAALKAAK